MFGKGCEGGAECQCTSEWICKHERRRSAGATPAAERRGRRNWCTAGRRSADSRRVRGGGGGSGERWVRGVVPPADGRAGTRAARGRRAADPTDGTTPAEE